jgi:SAM-dependent methyltransferase
MARIDNEEFYISAIEMYGLDARGLNWHSKEYQELRFEMLLSMLPKNLCPYTLADAGCGFGDLYLYMQRKKRLPKKYIGIDSLSDMYEIASIQTACEIYILDICQEQLPRTDIYLCSGAMNILEPAETVAFMQNCYNSCEYAFVFNILYGKKQSETYNYLTKENIHAIAETLGVTKVLFKDGYLKDDITVAFIKKDF